MKNIFNKINAPYLAIGTLATLALLASGVFAAAPYIGFLAPVAALSVGLPFVIGGAIISAVAIALSAVVINKNKTISEKDVQLANQAKEIKDKDKTISERDAQLTEESTDISNLRNQLDEEKAKEKEISKKESEGGKIVEGSSVSRLARAAVVGATATGGMLGGIAGGSILELYVDNSKEGDVRRGAIVDNVVYGLNTSYWLAKGTVNGAVSLTKGAANGTWYLGQYVYDNYAPSTESACNWVSSLKTAGWKVKVALLLTGATCIAINGEFTVADNSSNAVGNSTNGTESDASIPNLSSVCYRLTDQQIKQIQIDEASKKLADAERFCEDKYGISEEGNTNNKNEPQSVVSRILSISRNLWDSISNLISGSNESDHNRSEPQWYKNLHKSEDPEEIIDGGTLPSLFFPRVDNGANTSRQQSTLIDSVNLTKLTREVHSSV